MRYKRPLMKFISGGKRYEPDLPVTRRKGTLPQERHLWWIIRSIVLWVVVTILVLLWSMNL